MYNLLEYKQIAIAKINKSTVRSLPLALLSVAATTLGRRSSSVAILFFGSISLPILSLYCVQDLIYNTEHSHLSSLHYTFENLLQLALILVRVGLSLFLTPYMWALSFQVRIRCASVHCETFRRPFVHLIFHFQIIFFSFFFCYICSFLVHLVVQRYLQHFFSSSSHGRVCLYSSSSTILRFGIKNGWAKMKNEIYCMNCSST